MKRRLKWWLWLLIGFLGGLVYGNMFVYKDQIEFYTTFSDSLSYDIESKVGNVPNITCEENDITCKIKRKSNEYGIDWKLAVAISKHETGNYTSKAFKELNNVGGMMGRNGLKEYATLEEGIEAFVSNLKYNYIDEGLTTLELIQPKYCPIGAKNDPNGLNKYWLSGTNKYYKELDNE